MRAKAGEGENKGDVPNGKTKERLVCCRLQSRTRKEKEEEEEEKKKGQMIRRCPKWLTGWCDRLGGTAFRQKVNSLAEVTGALLGTFSRWYMPVQRQGFGMWTRGHSGVAKADGKKAGQGRARQAN
jgi:hypothetical protein